MKFDFQRFIVITIEIYFLCVKTECGQNYDVITVSKEFVEMVKVPRARGEIKRTNTKLILVIFYILFPTSQKPQ